MQKQKIQEEEVQLYLEVNDHYTFELLVVTFVLSILFFCWLRKKGKYALGDGF